MHGFAGCGLKAEHIEAFWICIDRNLRPVAEQVLVQRFSGLIRMDEFKLSRAQVDSASVWAEIRPGWLRTPTNCRFVF